MVHRTIGAESDLARKFTSRGLFAHAWDLSEPGADRLCDWMCEVGLDVMCLAGSYHSGWFVHPHNRRHRLFMTEGSVVYFHPRDELYAQTFLKPRIAALAQKTDWLSVAAQSARSRDLRLVSWTVGVHNTFLGQLFPECTQQNVYGDSIPHALSIGHDDTREYLKALCKDLATNYDLYGLQLEAFGWLSFRHNHHHERDLGSRELIVTRNTICVFEFNPAAMRVFSRGVYVESRALWLDQSRNVAAGRIDDRDPTPPSITMLKSVER